MPNDVSSGYNSGRVNLSQAPGADLDWDNLFPNPEVQPAVQSQTAPNGTTPQTQPQAATEPFLKAGDTVYKTAEDAVNGTVHKDQLIAKYRSYLSETGVDPNTLQKVVQPQTVQTTTSPYKYYNNPNLFDEIAAAASNRDRVKYTELFSNAIREGIQAEIAPWKPTLAETNRFKAVRQVSTEIPGFEAFYAGDGHKKIVDNFPLFKEMEQIGESDPVAAQRLHEVYRSEYLMWQGLQNQTQQQSQTAATPQVNPPVQSRPTLQSSALTPPAPAAPTAGWSQANWSGNKSLGNEARKQLIQDGNTKFQNLRFEDLGL